MVEIVLPAGMGPWDLLMDVAESTDCEEWVLIGGMMVMAHAQSRGRESRVTRDVDLLVDVMSSESGASRVVSSLETAGFVAAGPAFRGSDEFHRMGRRGQTVDVLVADHLPKWAKRHARVKGWSMVETEGGAQAVSRKMKVRLTVGDRSRAIYVPNLLGSIVIKAAAFGGADLYGERHLYDIALLSSMVDDPFALRAGMHGSDSKRIRKAWAALDERDSPYWTILGKDYADRGFMALKILATSNIDPGGLNGSRSECHTRKPIKGRGPKASGKGIDATPRQDRSTPGRKARSSYNEFQGRTSARS